MITVLTFTRVAQRHRVTQRWPMYFLHWKLAEQHCVFQRLLLWLYQSGLLTKKNNSNPTFRDHAGKPDEFSRATRIDFGNLLKYRTKRWRFFLVPVTCCSNYPTNFSAVSIHAFTVCANSPTAGSLTEQLVNKKS